MQRFGRDHAQAVWDAGLAAIAQIDASSRTHEIDCDFDWVDGYLHAPIDPAGSRPRRPDSRRRRRWRRISGSTRRSWSVSRCRHCPASGSTTRRASIRASISPAWRRRRQRSGGHIYEHSEADEFCDEPAVGEVNGHVVSCDDIVVATHNPLVGLASMAGATLFQTKLALYTSYVIAGRVAPGRIPDALFWDTADPYHYLRIEPHRDYDLVIFGGEDHKTGQAERHGRVLSSGSNETLTRAACPHVEVTHRWSGQVIETPDGLPYIGRSPIISTPRPALPATA